jgi:hypothetical protein
MNAISKYIFLGLLIVIASPLAAQDEEETATDLPVRATFESSILIDNQSVMVPVKKTLFFNIQHRFGTWDDGLEDLYGFWDPSNIRIGFSYTIINNLSIGFGTTKNSRLQDFSLKYGLLTQTRSGKIPVSISYYGNTSVDTRNGENFYNKSDRFSYFHQVIIARRFSRTFSFQVAPSFSHFNLIGSDMKNDHIALSFGGRAKITAQTSLIFNVDQPITGHDQNNPNPNIGFGAEVATSSHAFQVFFGNYNALVPQYNNVFNGNDFGNNEILIGFNITRLWNF